MSKIGRSFWVDPEFDNDLKLATKLTGLTQSKVIQLALKNYVQCIVRQVKAQVEYKSEK